MNIEIWKGLDGEYKVYCECYRTYKRIMSWKKSRFGSIYFNPNGSAAYNVVIPEEYLERAKLALKESGWQNEAKTTKLDQDLVLIINNLQEPKSTLRLSILK